MTEGQINIAIAKVLGWKMEAKKEGWPIRVVRPDGSELWHYDNRGNSYGPVSDWEYAVQGKFIPNYCNDLNAMHSALLTMDREQCKLFNGHLLDMERPRPDTEHQSLRWTWGSPARQYAEAFLRALNRWEAA